jgi:hypothetical protein
VFEKVSKLIFDELPSLPRQSGSDRISLPRGTVAPSAVVFSKPFSWGRNFWTASQRHDGTNDHGENCKH